MMLEDLLEEATKENLCNLVSDLMERLEKAYPEMAAEFEDELYECVHGKHFDAWSYKKATDGLVNSDGSKGPHWKLDDARKLMREKGIESGSFNEYDFAYALNMIWSDYYGAMPDNSDSYARMALAFLNDKDAPEGKAYVYWKKVAEGR